MNLEYQTREIIFLFNVGDESIIIIRGNDQKLIVFTMYVDIEAPTYV